MRQRKENVHDEIVEIDGGGKRRKLELQTSDRAALTFLCEYEEEVIMSGFYDS